MKLRKLLIVACALLLFTGCTGETTKKEEKVHVTMYLWDKSLSRSLTPWLQEKFPEYELEFVHAYNNMDYYTYLYNHNNLPDIITCRRFSINDAAHMSNMLMDLSKTELAGTFYSSYLENNRESDGAIRWLPACAEVDGFIANLDLFKEYGLEVPTNYSEFVNVLNVFKENNVTPFISDFRSDYTVLELMQGSAIPELMSREGTQWRMKYESETDAEPVGLDDEVWPVVFEKFMTLCNDLGVTAEMATWDFSTSATPFNEGTLPLMRGTANDCTYSMNNFGGDKVMLPYFGETAQDSWILTYPVCQFAVNKKVEEDAARKEAVMRILEAVFSQEGQEKIANNTAVLSYNKNVNIDLGPSMRYIQDAIDSNHMYMRLASTEFFSISKDVGHKLVKGEETVEEAYKDFNEQLISPKPTAEDEVLISQEKGYSHNLDEHGIPAVSSILNTYKEGMDKDIVIGFGNITTTDIYPEDYSLKTLKYLISFKAYLYEAELNGKEVIETLEWLINTGEDGSNPIRHYNLIPSAAGLEYKMKDNGDGTYSFIEATINGEAIDENKVYKVLLVGEMGYITDSIYCNHPLPENLKEKIAEKEG
ncbi:MAG: extracellular solute-binding protein, partial [Erysipelotrichaceae bacterium]